MNDYSELRAEHRPHEERCLNDDLMWPCDVISLLDEVERQSKKVAEVIEALGWDSDGGLWFSALAQIRLGQQSIDEVERLRAELDVAHGMLRGAACGNPTLNSSTGQQNAPAEGGDAP